MRKGNRCAIFLKLVRFHGLYKGEEHMKVTITYCVQ